MKKRKSKERIEAENDLLFYLEYYKKFPPESLWKFQLEIDRLEALLKRMD